MAILGYNTIGTAGTYFTVSGGVIGCKFVSSTNVTSSSLSAYIYSTGVSDVRFGICQDNAGTVGSLLALSNTGVNTTTAAWVTIPFEFDFIAGINYWFTIQPNDYLYLAYDTGGGTNQAAGGLNGDGLGGTIVAWPNYPDIPSSTFATYANEILSIYATVSDTPSKSSITGIQSIEGIQSITI